MDEVGGGGLEEVGRGNELNPKRVGKSKELRREKE